MTKDFGKEYLVGMKSAKAKDGTISSVQGCLEYPF